MRSDADFHPHLHLRPISLSTPIPPIEKWLEINELFEELEPLPDDGEFFLFIFIYTM
jgi:hypothetical protein